LSIQESSYLFSPWDYKFPKKFRLQKSRQLIGQGLPNKFLYSFLGQLLSRQEQEEWQKNINHFDPPPGTHQLSHKVCMNLSSQEYQALKEYDDLHNVKDISESAKKLLIEQLKINWNQQQ